MTLEPEIVLTRVLKRVGTPGPATTALKVAHELALEGWELRKISDDRNAD